MPGHWGEGTRREKKSLPMEQILHLWRKLYAGRGADPAQTAPLSDEASGASRSMTPYSFSLFSRPRLLMPNWAAVATRFPPQRCSVASMARFSMSFRLWEDR